MKPSEIIKEIKNVLSDAKLIHSVYLTGNGVFIDTKGNRISEYAVLKMLTKLNDAVERVDSYVNALPKND